MKDSTLNLLEVVPVPCLRDNYAYLLFSQMGGGKCLIIDACESRPVKAELKRRGLEPAAILTTHHHWDHIGGNQELSQQYSIPVYGHETEFERIPAMTVGLKDKQRFSVAGISGYCLHLPGHTQGALSYVIGDRCFVGDTLFCGGCGRLKEGTAEQLHQSLSRLTSVLTVETQLYTGHEYTLANLEFAESVLRLPEITRRLAEVRTARSKGLYCASASLDLELSTNLFLNCHRTEVQRAVLGSDWTKTEAGGRNPDVEGETFARLRILKDQS